MIKSTVCKRKRGRCQIVKSILEAAGKGANKTRIMKKARLNSAQVNSYLDTLERQNLLSMVDLSTCKSVAWKTTDAGHEIVKSCEKCYSLLSEIL